MDISPARLRLSAILVALAVALAVASFVLDAKPTLDVPAWSVGDAWTYNEEGLATPFPPAGQITYRIMAMDAVAVGGASIEAYHAEISARFLTNQSFYHVADEWYRTSDLAVVRRSVIYPTCYPVNTTFTCNNVTWTSTFDPPLPLRFPITVGESWSAVTAVSTERFNVQGAPVVWFNYSGGLNASVGPLGTVSVPAGNFTAMPVTENYSGGANLLSSSYVTYTVRDFSEAAGNIVQETDYEPNPHGGGGLGVAAVIQLVSFAYAPPWYAIPALGLPLWAWLIVGAAVGITGTVVLLRRRRRRAAPHAPPEPPNARP